MEIFDIYNNWLLINGPEITDYVIKCMTEQEIPEEDWDDTYTKLFDREVDIRFGEYLTFFENRV